MFRAFREKRSQTSSKVHEGHFESVYLTAVVDVAFATADEEVDNNLSLISLGNLMITE